MNAADKNLARLLELLELHRAGQLADDGELRELLRWHNAR